MGPETISGRRISGLVVGVVGLGLFGAGIWEGFMNGPATRDQIMRAESACLGVIDLNRISYSDLRERVEQPLLYLPRMEFEALARGAQFMNLRDCYVRTRNKIELTGLGPNGWRLPLVMLSIAVGSATSIAGFSLARSRARTV